MFYECLPAEDFKDFLTKGRQIAWISESHNLSSNGYAVWSLQLFFLPTALRSINYLFATP